MAVMLNPTELGVHHHSVFVFLPLVETVALLLRDVYDPSTKNDLPLWRLRWLRCAVFTLCPSVRPSVLPLRHFTSSCPLRPACAPPAPRVPIDCPRHAPLAAKKEATICWCASGRRWHFKGMPARNEPAPHWPRMLSVKGGRRSLLPSLRRAHDFSSWFQTRSFQSPLCPLNLWVSAHTFNFYSPWNR